MSGARGAGLTVGGLFSGVGGFSEGFRRAGCRPLWEVEIDPACRAVLRRHFPDALILDDVRTAGAHNLPHVDVVTGGFPCQDLSVAGARAGLAGNRSGLFFEIIRVVREMREATGGLFPKHLVLENVPGLLSSNGNRDFAVVLGELAGLGAVDIAWRILDAQFFAVAQRRRRVFIVVSFGNNAGATEILFERESGSRHTPPRREARQGAARGAAAGVGIGGWLAACDTADTLSVGANQTTGFVGDVVGIIPEWPAEVAPTLGTGWADRHPGSQNQDWVAQKGGLFVPDVSPTISSKWAKGTGGPSGNETQNLISVVAYALGSHAGSNGAASNESHAAGGPVGMGIVEEATPALRAGRTQAVAAIAFTERGRADGVACETQEELAYALTNPGEGGRPTARGVLTPAMAVRRLTPRECSRLMAFPDDWLEGLGLSDSTKYRMLGNSVVVNVAEWLARRIVGAG